jgi:hypothetical protein
MNTSNIVIKHYSLIDKKNLLSYMNVKNFKRDEKIFNLIHNKNIKYSKNNNGIFFDLNQLNNEILFEIEKIISYYEIKKKCKYDYSDSSEKKN